MSYGKYLVDLMNLWAGWSKSPYMRKYLYMSLGLVVVLGLLIGSAFGLVRGYLMPLGIPVAFLLISGFDWLKRRRALKSSYEYVRDHSDYSVQMEEEFEHPEEFDDLEDTQELNADWPEEHDDMFSDEMELGAEDRLGSVDHMPDDETHN